MWEKRVQESVALVAGDPPVVQQFLSNTQQFFKHCVYVGRAFTSQVFTHACHATRPHSFLSGHRLYIIPPPPPIGLLRSTAARL